MFATVYLAAAARIWICSLTGLWRTRKLVQMASLLWRAHVRSTRACCEADLSLRLGGTGDSPFRSRMWLPIESRSTCYG